MILDEKARAAIKELQSLNAQDPNQVEVGGDLRPRELLHAERLAQWVDELAGEPSLPLALAAHCQHLMRWTVPRTDYPEGRVGYLRWRKDLAKMHADRASEVFRRHGLDERVIEAVRTINLKQDLKRNPDSQTMEDALCLSFLQYEFADFSAKHEDDKVVDIVQKTWRKMSPRAREIALTLPWEGRPGALVTKALS